MIDLVWRAGASKPFVISVLCFRLGLYVLHVGTHCRELPIWLKWPLARRCLTTAFLGCDRWATLCYILLPSTAPGAQLYAGLNAVPPQEQLQIHSETWKWSRVWSSSSTVRKYFCKGKFDSFLWLWRSIPHPHVSCVWESICIRFVRTEYFYVSFNITGHQNRICHVKQDHKACACCGICSIFGKLHL